MPGFFIDPDIAKAKTLDKAFYTDPLLFEEAKEKLFSPSWQFIGDVSLAAQSGQMHPLMLLEDFLDEPLLLTNHDNELHLLSNVCTHRGNILVHAACSAPHIRCRYHGRVFQPDGKFRSMPEFKEVLDFPSPSDDLAQLSLFRWGNWLFTSLTPRHPAPTSPATAFLGEMMHRLAWLPFDRYVFRPDRSSDFLVRAHWALYCENYLEGFHIPFVHAGLNTVIEFDDYLTELYGYSSLQLGIAKPGEEVFDLPESSPDYGKRVAAYYFFVFPNLMFNFYPWGLSVNIVNPVGLRETRISFLTWVADESKYGKGAGAGLDTVEMEDEEVVEAVQQGILSRFYRHGRYSVNREQGTHHFHRLIAGLMT